jgi:hypothetical protein
MIFVGYEKRTHRNIDDMCWIASLLCDDQPAFWGERSDLVVDVDDLTECRQVLAFSFLGAHHFSAEVGVVEKEVSLDLRLRIRHLPLFTPAT